MSIHCNLWMKRSEGVVCCVTFFSVTLTIPFTYYHCNVTRNMSNSIRDEEYANLHENDTAMELRNRNWCHFPLKGLRLFLVARQRNGHLSPKLQGHFFDICWSQRTQIGKHESALCWYHIRGHLGLYNNVFTTIFSELSEMLCLSCVSGIHHWRVLPSELEGWASLFQRPHGDATIEQPPGQQHLDSWYLFP